jgi:hypothetical protein
LRPVTSPVTAGTAATEDGTCSICGDTTTRSNTLSDYIKDIIPAGTSATSPHADAIPFAAAFSPSDLTHVGTSTSGTVSPVGAALRDNPTKYVKLDFSACTGLTNIPNYAFCIRTEVPPVPPSVTSTYTYAGLPTLVEIKLPTSVTTIRQYAFYGCNGLKIGVCGQVNKSNAPDSNGSYS